jgi:hypothetical protein
MSNGLALPSWCQDVTRSTRFVATKRKYGDDISGVVAAVGQKWIVLHDARDLAIDGLVAMRIADLTSFKIDSSGKSVVLRSFRNRNLFHGPVAGLRLDSTADALLSLSEIAPLVVVHPDRRWPGTCHLGRISSLDREAKKFELLEVAPSAVWDEEPSAWRFRDIRLIQVGDKYSSAIFDLAGEPIVRADQEPG